MESGGPEHHHHHAMKAGTIEGHVTPGIAVILFGSLWTYNALFRYHVALRQAVLRGSDTNKLNYSNMLFSKYHSGWAHAAPVEAFVVVFVWFIVCSGEITFGHPWTMVVHHMFIYSFYGAMGAVKILQHYKFAMPPNSEYAMFIVVNAAEAFLLSNHLFGRPIVDKQLHMIQVYVNLILIVCAALEIIYNRSVTAALGRTLLFITEGILLCGLGVIIFPYPFMHQFDLDDPELLNTVTALAVAVIPIVLMIAITMNFIISKRVEKMNLATVNRIVALTHYRCVSSGSKGDVDRPLISDSDYGI